MISKIASLICYTSVKMVVSYLLRLNHYIIGLAVVYSL